MDNAKRIEKQRMNKEIGDRLRMWCDEQFQNYKEAADILGTVPQTLNNWFNGKYKPTLPALKKIDESGGDSRWIMTGESSEITHIEYKMIELLRKHNIKDVAQLQRIIDADSLSDDIVELINERRAVKTKR